MFQGPEDELILNVHQKVKNNKLPFRYPFIQQKQCKSLKEKSKGETTVFFEWRYI